MISDRLEKPLASWRGKERYENNLLDCLTIIFRSGGCGWAACRMCSYRHERIGDESCGALLGHLKAQLAWVMNEYPQADYRMVKIFTSGSFFDPHEVPPEFLGEVARSFRGKLVIAETRPEFIKDGVLGQFIEGLDDGSWKMPLYCAIGLETSNDTIREKCINKGFTFRDFQEAAIRARKAGAGVKAYLLFKPLFLSEQEAIKDMKTTFSDVVPTADIISMNPCTVQRNTELEYYWRRGAYRPPYLWSVLSLLATAPVHVSCDPLGGGQKRGPHNCGTCDYEIVKGIRDFSLNGDRDLIGALMDISCQCKREWEFILAEEKSYAMPLTR